MRKTTQIDFYPSATGQSIHRRTSNMPTNAYSRTVEIFDLLTLWPTMAKGLEKEKK